MMGIYDMIDIEVMCPECFKPVIHGWQTKEIFAPFLRTFKVFSEVQCYSNHISAVNECRNCMNHITVKIYIENGRITNRYTVIDENIVIDNISFINASGEKKNRFANYRTKRQEKIYGKMDPTFY